jgi:hypothetical protein
MFYLMILFYLNGYFKVITDRGSEATFIGKKACWTLPRFEKNEEF